MDEPKDSVSLKSLDTTIEIRDSDNSNLRKSKGGEHCTEN